MKSAFFIFLFYFIYLIIFPAHAWNYGDFFSCDSINPNPQITLSTSYGQLVHDLSSNQKKIDKIQKTNGIKEKGYLQGGVSTAELTYNLRLSEIKTQYVDENATCVAPKNINIFVGYKNPTIYIANKYKPQSCEFSHIIRHEQLHQYINKIVLDAYLPLIEKIMRQAIQEKPSTKVPHRRVSKQGTLYLQNYYNAQLTALMEQMKKTLQQEHERFDKEYTYATESWDICRIYEKIHPQKEEKTKNEKSKNTKKGT